MSDKHCLISFRRGTASEWAASLPQPDGEVLKLGEPGYEKDTGKLKIGDGVSGWNNLPYLQGQNSEDVILTQEDVDDAVANLLVPGSGIVLSYDDDENSLTISTSGLQPAGNYATLVNGLVPESQLPSYVDDVLEFANLASFPNPGEAGKIYVTLDTNKTYRWSGSTYIEISSGPSSSDDVPEGSVNLYYTNDRVDELLKAGSYINISYDSVDLTISATGLQPSGDYSVVGHSHVVNDITDFSVGVSGLLPTISDPDDNRLLTSDGTSTGINAEANLTFDNDILCISGDNPSVKFAGNINPEGYLLAENGDFILDENGNKILLSEYNQSDEFALLISSNNISNSSEISSTYPLTISSIVDVSGSLTVNNVNVSLEGHSHVVNDITDFSVGVSGLLPTISNPADNRLLTSDGTSTGINAESKLTFDDKILRIQCECSSGSAGFVGVGDGNIVNFRANQFFDGNVEPPRLIFRRTRGSEASPQIANADDGIFAIRGETIDYNGQAIILGGLRMEVVEPASSTSLNPATKIFLRTSSGGDNLLDKTLTLNSDGTLVNTGTIKVFDTPVSLEGHSHVVNDITDFSSSVSGLLPTIANSGDNRLLTSDGTSTGINAESKLTFNPNEQNIPGLGPQRAVSGATLTITHEQPVDSSFAEGPFLKLKAYGRDFAGAAPRIHFEKYRGTESSLLPVEDGDNLGAIRWFNQDSSNDLTNIARILVIAQGSASGENNFVPTRMVFNTSSGPAQLDNTFQINSNGNIDTNCSLTVDGGLSAPTKIHNLGLVSGNVSISYAIDKQIQTLSLDGTSTNFIEGSDWPSATSVDVLLEITVNTSTSVTWTMVDDFYNPVPSSLSPGKYLVLLRNIGTTMQGHYIGEKTN